MKVSSTIENDDEMISDSLQQSKKCMLQCFLRVCDLSSSIMSHLVKWILSLLQFSVDTTWMEERRASVCWILAVQGSCSRVESEGGMYS